MSNEISEYDVVIVVAINPSIPNAEIGDIAAVLMVHTNSGVVVGYEVECVLPDGTNKWEGTFLPEQIKLVAKAWTQNT